MKIRSNRNVVFSCTYHVVFCPRYRLNILRDGVDERFKEIAGQVSIESGFEIIEMEVMPDHAHLLLSVDPQMGVHKVVKQIKGRTSRVLRKEFPRLKNLSRTLWASSYFVATTGGATLETVKRYIESQKRGQA